MKQRQDSVTDQLHDLIKLANQHGMYDAADWIRDRLAPSAEDCGFSTLPTLCRSCGQSEGNHIDRIGAARDCTFEPEQLRRIQVSPHRARRK